MTWTCTKKCVTIVTKAVNWFLFVSFKFIYQKFVKPYSVDGGKLYHGYSTSSNKRKQECISGCPCGNNEGPPNDIKALCSAMLHSQGIAEKLVAAYVSNHCSPTHHYILPSYHIFIKLISWWPDFPSHNNKPSSGALSWADVY